CHVFTLYQKRAADRVVSKSPACWRKAARERDDHADHHENREQEPESALWSWAEYCCDDCGNANDAQPEATHNVDWHRYNRESEWATEPIAKYKRLHRMRDIKPWLEFCDDTSAALILEQHPGQQRNCCNRSASGDF